MESQWNNLLNYSQKAYVGTAQKQRFLKVYLLLQNWENI